MIADVFPNRIQQNVTVEILDVHTSNKSDAEKTLYSFI